MKDTSLEAGRVNAPSGTTSEPVATEPQGSAGESPAQIHRTSKNQSFWERHNAIEREAAGAESDQWGNAHLELGREADAEIEWLLSAVRGARDLIAGEFFAEALGELDEALNGEDAAGEPGEQSDPSIATAGRKSARQIDGDVFLSMRAALSLVVAAFDGGRPGLFCRLDLLRNAEPKVRAALLLSIANSPAETSAIRPPDGYAYRYPDGTGGVIRFNNGQEVNGYEPLETLPYWLGPAPPTRFPKHPKDCRHDLAMLKCSECGIDFSKVNVSRSPEKAAACRSCGHVPAPGQQLTASGNCLVCEAL